MNYRQKTYIQGAHSDLKVEELSCKRCKQSSDPGACPWEFFLRPHLSERRKMPFLENERPSYCLFAVEDNSILIQVDCICILKKPLITFSGECRFKVVLSDNLKFFQLKAELSFDVNLHRVFLVMRFC